MSVIRVDLNADVGEGAGHDAALMPAITSANVACGLHAGGPATMRATVTAALRHGVAIGAHPSLDDREAFGRRELPTTPGEAAALVSRQIEALSTLATSLGAPVRHVKPHGALYNMAARDAGLADAIAQAVKQADPSLVLFGLAGSRLIEAGRRAGLRTASEVFADRAYQADGALVPRTRPGAVLHDVDAVVARALGMVARGRVRSIDGQDVPIEVDTICVHGDTPGAVGMAMRLRQALRAIGIDVRAVSDS